ncbi:dihydrofolate reductase [Legionella londiniensis]|uniref:Dihydrofolate reductase n=1 Tax=Legionella londiniensis TaxID=45068 RepID=A0A0W0VII8_9GAMM|nr:dihydrofolate reductase [Legionella londiniensis]KTD19944.1 dihydrofolate reductase FolA [Legionella londiniensis]STX94183.1 dihydrofolate reductase [Legionella londiniensis]
MSIISLIAAVDKNFALGKDNQLLCHLPSDLRHFKLLTLGKPVIMGRKTFFSIGKPLPERHNIVISKTMHQIEGMSVVSSLSEALAVGGYASEIMIIGGEKVFAEALPLADRLYLTHIHHQFDADVFFPSFNIQHWQCVEKTYHSSDEQNQYAMTFCTYHRIKPD